MARTRIGLAAVLATALVATAACSASGSGGSAAESAPLAAGGSGTASAAASAAGPAAAPAAGSTTTDDGGYRVQAAALVQRDIIRTAQLTVRTKDVKGAAARAQDAARGLGGLVGNADVSTDPDHPDATTADLQLRVPTARYDALVERVSALGAVVHKSEKAADVTAQVVDVQSRLATECKSLDQVRALLDRAGTLQQVLIVERDLTRREADLESLESQRKVLADQTTLATIDLTLVTPKAAPPPPPPKRHLGFVTGVIAGWHGLAHTTVVAATAVGALLPWLLPLALLVLLLGLLWRRFRPRGGAPAIADAD